MILVPGQSLGNFQLGMALPDAIELLKADATHFELLFNDAEPLQSDICLKVPKDGMNLRFEPKSQRLHLIDVYDLMMCRLSYTKNTVNTCFADAHLTPTFLLIYELFGPTYPGQYDKSKQAYFLKYPGLSFLFPIPEEFRDLYDGTGNNNEVPLEMPDGTTPAATRFFVYTGPSAELSTLPPLCEDDEQAEHISAQLWGDLQLNFRRLRCSISTQSTAQDVLSSLGEPSDIYCKGGSGSVQGINSTSDRAQQSHQHHRTYPDYFYNYSRLGLDLLFDAQSHLLKKMILHTNSPAHQNFHTYHKCQFQLLLPPDASSGDCSSGDSHATTDGIDGISHSGAVTCDMKWDAVQRICGSGGRPMVHGSSTAAHPFGKTYFYAPYPGCIFEVMRNGHMAGVVLFKG